MIHIAMEKLVNDNNYDNENNNYDDKNKKKKSTYETKYIE